MKSAMNRKLFSAAALVCVLVLSPVMCVTAAAQQPPATPQPSPAAVPATPAAGSQPGQASGSQTGNPGDSNYTIRTSVNEVNLIFTVTDRHGNFIPNLKQSDF